nr:hypothetical protein [Candidatus Sigynarchaeota archaeon]
MLDYTKLKIEIVELMKKGKINDVRKKLVDAFTEVRPLEYQQIGEAMKEIIMVDPQTFSRKVYYLLNKEMRAINKDKLVEFEKFFIQNFCKLPGEDFISISDGQLETGKSTISGTIFVSNLRIIATGVQELKDTKNLAGILPFMLYGYVRQIMEQIAKSMTIEFAADKIVNYGFMFPIKNNYLIERKENKKDRIKYKVDFPYTNDKEKEEIAHLDICVIISEKNPEMELTLTKIEETLKSVTKVELLAVHDDEPKDTGGESVNTCPRCSKHPPQPRLATLFDIDFPDYCTRCKNYALVMGTLIFGSFIIITPVLIMSFGAVNGIPQWQIIASGIGTLFASAFIVLLVLTWYFKKYGKVKNRHNI